MIFESYYIKCTKTGKTVGSESLVDSTDHHSENGKKWVHFDLTQPDRKAKGLSQGRFRDSNNTDGRFGKEIPVIRVPFTPTEIR